MVTKTVRRLKMHKIRIGDNFKEVRNFKKEKKKLKDIKPLKKLK